MSSEKDEKDQGAQEILYWAVALVGLVAIKQLWTERVRPWIEGTWGDLRAGELLNLPIIGRVDPADIMAIAVLTVVLLVGMGVVVSRLKRWRDTKSRDR